MSQFIAQVSLLVKDYDEAISFYTDKLGFDLVEDTQLDETKRWVIVRPVGGESGLLLAKASKQEQQDVIGNQGGGRVWLFLKVDDFHKSWNQIVNNGVEVVREPVEQAYGWVGVFADLYGNKWDLLENRS